MSRHLLTCPHCDALHRRPALRRGEKASCRRCGTVLLRQHRLTPEQVLALVVTALLVYVIANSFPIVNLQVQGLTNSTTLFGAVFALWDEGRQLMAVLVFATTQLFPLLDLAGMLALLLAVTRSGPRPSWFSPLLRFIQSLRPWGMTEVFMLGVVVSLVKLSGMAHILPGVALWAFAALTVLMAVILSFHPRQLWDEPRHD
ncbi:paraquat-inducible protein A [Magnetospirillum sulfuroxidans]|uniref:Paraquat-inducible protein A n=1 Tax=Magnetospirillum sulfuroxidans TaxID=611300 RepID=A0ABS5IFV4_9PROT|nr:paraquat-inducible protein A [Magnetospirillum sulfuroxidans]MBR9973141.1 paraquat-inducible protein A [Magnetospirillum sulfuroxidans]